MTRAQHRILMSGLLAIAASISVTALYMTTLPPLEYTAMSRMVPEMLEHYAMSAALSLGGAMSAGAIAKRFSGK